MDRKKYLRLCWAAAAARCASKSDDVVVNWDASEACDVGTTGVEGLVPVAPVTAEPNQGQDAIGKRYPIYFL